MNRFPLRAAAIDVGSNAMRLLAAEFEAPDRYRPLAEDRLPVRLGAAAFSGDGTLDESVMTAAVVALTAFRRRLDELNVQTYRAVATSAVRDAGNGDELIARIRREAGIRLETITAGEEARLVWLAAGRRLGVSGGHWLFIDVGGGSVEIGQATGVAVHRAESYAMGAVRLLEELAGSTTDPQEFRQRASELIERFVASITPPPQPVAGLVATGGNIEELARLAGRTADADGVVRLPHAVLASEIDRLASMTTQQRIAVLGMRPDRADVVLPAALVYERVARFAAVTEITVPYVGLKDGLLLDAVHNAARSGADGEPPADIAAHAIELGRRYHFDEDHARHVARLAVSLFDQLHEQLQLDEADRPLLHAAALLHDTGKYIAQRAHHKHSYALILDAGLPGLETDETLLVALIARYHRRADPKPKHEGFGTLPDRDRQRVCALAALLRLADALDREHRQHVLEVAAGASDGVLRLGLTTRGSALRGRNALEKKARLLTGLLGMELEVRSDGI